jgi:hypothetical protein
MKRIKAACKAVVIAVGMTTILLIVITSGLDHYYQAGMVEGRPARLGTYTPPE